MSEQANEFTEYEAFLNGDEPEEQASPNNYVVVLESGEQRDVWADSAAVENGLLSFYQHKSIEETVVRQQVEPFLFFFDRTVDVEETQTRIEKSLVACYAPGTWLTFFLSDVTSDYGGISTQWK